MWSTVSKNSVQIREIEETVWSRHSVRNIKHKYKHTGRRPYTLLSLSSLIPSELSFEIQIRCFYR
jgi:hypothetical protein